MVITVVCDVLGKENNGTTIAAMNLIRALKERGHTVRVVCSDPNRAGMKDYYVVPRMDLGPLNGYIAKNGVALSRPDTNILAASLNGADHVHIMLPFALGKTAVQIARDRDLPVTAGFHCQAENLTGHLFMKNFAPANYIAYRAFYHDLYRFCDLVHYPSRFICDTFEAVVGPTPHRIISNGVNRCFHPKKTEKPDELRGKFVVLFTGRYGPEKRHDVLIDAVALSRHKDEIQLIFAGSGPKKEALQKRAGRRGINMPIMNFYDRASLIDVINYSDLYVHPADIEIEAIACLEAIACGKVPLIADSPRSATRFFALSDRNLFSYNQPQSLADGLDWWIEHPAERKVCAEKYLGYAAQFEYGHCMDMMEKMIIEAGEKHREK
jgi:glycosyltransferase involved in cell wall biosynthesis